MPRILETLRLHDDQAVQYQRLQASPENDEEKGQEAATSILEQESQGATKRKSVIRLVIAGVTFTILTVLLLGVFQFFFGGKKPLDQCGHTPEEARDLGCVFEVTSFSWVTPECYDEETEAEFLAAKDWKFWRDINATESVTVDEVKLGEATGFFVEWEFHTGHCGYLFKKLHRALKKGGKVDSYIWPLEHTDHCVNFMINPPEKYVKARQFTYRKYPFCGRDGGVGVEIPASQKIFD